MGEGGDDCGGGVGGEEVYSGNTEPALVLVLDSYSEDEEISVGDSGPVKIVDSGLYFISSFHFILFFFYFYFYFSIFRTAWVRVDWSRCHISHKLMVKSQD